MTRPVTLLDSKAAQKAASGPGPADRRLEAQRTAAAAGHQTRRSLFGHGAPAAPVAPVTHVLSSFMSGTDTLPRVAPETTAKRADTAPLHPLAAKLRSRFGDDAARLLSAVAQRSDAAGGAAVDFTSLDASRLLSVPEPRARAVMDGLLHAGALISRRSPFGGRAGYTVADPTA